MIFRIKQKIKQTFVFPDMFVRASEILNLTIPNGK